MSGHPRKAELLMPGLDGATALRAAAITAVLGAVFDLLGRVMA